jgi:hypothetical protein
VAFLGRAAIHAERLHGRLGRRPRLEDGSTTAQQHKPFRACKRDWPVNVLRTPTGQRAAPESLGVRTWLVMALLCTRHQPAQTSASTGADDDGGAAAVAPSACAMERRAAPAAPRERPVSSWGHCVPPLSARQLTVSCHVAVTRDVVLFRGKTKAQDGRFIRPEGLGTTHTGARLPRTAGRPTD